MMINQNEPKPRRNYPRSLTPSERAANSIGLQNWYRQFQPSFSPDPMVVEEFKRGFGFRPFPDNVRGPQARFAPGGQDFKERFDELPPERAFYRDTVFGTATPVQYQNRWESNEARRQRKMLPFIRALYKKL